MSDEVNLTALEMTEAIELLLLYYPSSYVVRECRLHKQIGPVVSKVYLTDKEVLGVLKGLLVNARERIERLDVLIKSIGREHRLCKECAHLFIAWRKDQVFCPGGSCSNRWHQREWREKNC